VYVTVEQPIDDVAGPSVIPEQDPATGYAVLEVRYDAQDANELVGLVRGFAMDITVDSGASIVGISDYLEGESTQAAPGYGIFMGTVEIEPNGSVRDWDDPIGDPCDPDTLGGLGTGGVTVELGSLYDPDKPEDSPLTTGLLFKLTVDIPKSDTQVATCNVTVSANTTRGGIVLEDASSANLVSMGSGSVTLYKMWKGRTFDEGACTNDFVVAKLMQRHYIEMLLDSTWTEDELGWACPWQKCGQSNTGAKPNKKRVDTLDLGDVSASWFKTKKSDWNSGAGPYNPRADYDCSRRVDTLDLGVLSSNWFTTPGKCPNYPNEI
jgi:hypothetical protein